MDALAVAPNFDNGELVNGPMPKKKKNKVVIDEFEYEELQRKSHLYLENLVEARAQQEAFNLKSNPWFDNSFN